MELYPSEDPAAQAPGRHSVDYVAIGLSMALDAMGRGAEDDLADVLGAVIVCLLREANVRDDGPAIRISPIDPTAGRDPSGLVAEYLARAADEWLKWNERPLSYSAIDAQFVWAAESVFWKRAGALKVPTTVSQDLAELLNGHAIPKDGVPVVYRHWGAEQTLLYVGFSSKFRNRQGVHRRSLWWDEIERITFTAYDSIAAAVEAEALAIRSEDPIYNKAGR